MPEWIDGLLDDQSRRWSLGSGRRVEEYLAEHPQLRNDPEKLLDLVYHEVVLRQRHGEVPEWTEYARRFPELATQLCVHFAVHEVFESGLEVQGVAGVAASEPLAVPLRVARFQLTRFHARGGLGEVFVAQDLELPRDVAFKRLQPRFAHDPNSRARFVREAEITSRLEHPGIVPVYGLLHDDDGRPGYAMRFIRGELLSTAIHRLHAETSLVERRLELRRLLGRFVAVCHAVAYAHSLGVLHRDLKPANIMLGPFGETLVIDWGLARDMANPALTDADPPEARPARIAATPLSQAHATASQETTVGGTQPAELLGDAVGKGRETANCQLGVTQQGELLGTPAFMSPEQAGGDWRQVGPASDTYSLGATLYTLLTGTPPFLDTDPKELLARLQRGDQSFDRPRQRQASVPRALEAVCLKALAAHPRDRYTSAQDLADEIDRWLADEPVAAWNSPWHERAARWMRRHPTWATGAAVALVVASIAAPLLYVSDRQTRGEQYTAAASLFNEGAYAESVGDYDTAAFSYRMAIARLEPLSASDPRIQARIGVGFHNLASMYLNVNDLDGAEVALRRACDEFAPLLRDQPERDRPRSIAAAAWHKLGVLRARQGRIGEAESAFQYALELMAPWLVVSRLPNPSQPRHEHRYLGALIHFTRAEFERDQGTADQAEADYRAAARLLDLAMRQVARSLPVSSPEPRLRLDVVEPQEYPEYQRLLVGCHEGLASLYSRLGRPESADEAAAARRCRQHLVNQQLAAGERLFQDRNLLKAQSAFEESLELLLKMAATPNADDSAAALDADLLATTRNNLAEVHRHLGHPRLADLVKSGVGLGK